MQTNSQACMYLYTYQIITGVLLLTLLTLGTYLVWTLTKDAASSTLKRKRG